MKVLRALTSFTLAATPTLPSDTIWARFILNFDKVVKRPRYGIFGDLQRQQEVGGRSNVPLRPKGWMELGSRNHRKVPRN